MSDTPMCDKELIIDHCKETCMEIHSVDYNFACGLERQLNAANAKIVELQGQLIAQSQYQDENYTFGIRG